MKQNSSEALWVTDRLQKKPSAIEIRTQMKQNKKKKGSTVFDIAWSDTEAEMVIAEERMSSVASSLNSSQSLVEKYKARKTAGMQGGIINKSTIIKMGSASDEDFSTPTVRFTKMPRGLLKIFVCDNRKRPVS